MRVPWGDGVVEGLLQLLLLLLLLMPLPFQLLLGPLLRAEELLLLGLLLLALDGLRRLPPDPHLLLLGHLRLLAPLQLLPLRLCLLLLGQLALLSLQARFLLLLLLRLPLLLLLDEALQLPHLLVALDLVGKEARGNLR